MPVPNTFANATATIPLSQLDANFATTITLGNTAIQLGNTVTTLNNMTLANVTISSGNVTITNVSVTTANVTTANIATAQIANVTVSGTGTFAAGSNTAPSITTSGDTNTGIFFPAADQVAIATGGSQRAVVDASGRVGIGETSPAVTLHLKAAVCNVRLEDADTSAYANIGVDNSGSMYLQADPANSQASTAIYFATDGTERMRLDSSGNLGLGVTPSAWGRGKAFEVGSVGNGVWSDTGSNDINAFSTNAYLSNTTISSGWKFAYSGYAVQYRQSSGQHQWYTSTASGTAGNAITFTQAMTLDASGNLQLGVTSGSGNRLNVVGTGGIRVNEDGSGTKILTIRSDYAGVDPAINVLTNNSLLLMTNNTERARITSEGNFGIGFSSPDQPLAFADSLSVKMQFNGNNTNGYQIAMASAVSGGDAMMKFIAGETGSGEFGFYNTTNLRLFISSGGEVRVGSATDQGAYNLQCNGTGVWGAAAYVNGSDKRIKEDIAPITSGLDVVTKLNPVTYRYKKDWSNDQNIQTGFIAQELLVSMEGKNYVNGIVLQGGSENYYSVAYQNIIPLLTKAIQEQQAMIDELKAKVAALENA